MKAAAFEFSRPTTLEQALSLLAGDGARVLAGGQSLGPMLNARLARPDRLVQVNHLAELTGFAPDADAVTIGACVTHAAIADGGLPDIGGNVLARVADGIAYRAVRNRGTIGGSLCHADPAADWCSVLTVLDAAVLLRGPTGARELPVADFIVGPFRTALGPGEILCAVRVPRLPPDARFGYVKACRKPGDFAHAMAAVLLTATNRRVVIGALGGRPVLLRDDAASIEGATRALDWLDAVRGHMSLTTVRRALAEAAA